MSADLCIYLHVSSVPGTLAGETLTSSCCGQDNPTTRIGAILGLGLAYAGKRREDVGELLTPLLSDSAVSMEVASFAALALGLVFVGSCHEDSINALLQVRVCSFLFKYLSMGRPGGEGVRLHFWEGWCPAVALNCRASACGCGGWACTLVCSHVPY